MTVSYHRPTKAIIDLEAIRQNIKQEINWSKKEVFAVVKANGYGHGLVPVAIAAADAGVSGFCVATLDEGIELRQSGLMQPIIVLSVIPVQDVLLAIKYDISITVTTLKWLEKAQQVLSEESFSSSLKIHIKLDTGMGRIGFLTSSDVLEAIDFIEQSPNFNWEGIFTHYATADQIDGSYWEKQHTCFEKMLSKLPYLPTYVHDSNSATSLWHHSQGNMVRLGIAMYGLNPSGRAMEEVYPLKPALSLESELIQVKCLAQGAGIGYGKTYETTEEQWIGTVPIGYADGYPRKLQGYYVLIQGQRCEIVGRICMDQLMVRLPHEFPEGSKVTLIGQDGDEQITLQDIADQLETIHYEVACLLSARIPREYK